MAARQSPPRHPDARSIGSGPHGARDRPGGRYAVGVAETRAAARLLDRQVRGHQQEFKQFVDAGGYRDAKYWKEPFRDGAARAHVRRGDGAISRLDRPAGSGGVAARQLSRRTGGLSGGRHQLVRGGGLCRIRRQAPADDLSLVSRRRAPRISSRTSCGSATSTARARSRWASVLASVRGARSTWRAT